MERELNIKFKTNEDKFQHLISQAPVIIATFVGPTYIVENINEMACTVWGKSYEEVINKPLFESSPELEPGLSDILSAIYTTGEPFIANEIPVQLKRAGKLDSAYFNSVYQPLRDSANAICGIILISTDVSDAVNARKLIEEKELFNRSVLESSSDCFKVLDTDGRITYLNQNGMCQLEIDDFSNIENKEWRTIWGNENQGIVQKSVETALQGHVSRFTAFCFTAKGTPKWWDVEVSPIKKNGQPIKEILAVSRDITEQKNLSDALEKTASHFKIATDSADVGVWSFDVVTQQVEWSNLHKRMWGYDETRTDLTYEDWHTVIVEEDKATTFGKLEEARLNQKLYEVEYRIKKSDDGLIRWIKAIGQFYYDDAGEAKTLAGISIDITQHKLEETQLKLLTKVVINANDAILITEIATPDKPKLNIVYANESFAKMTGYSIDELLGNSPSMFQGPNTDQAELQKLRTAMQKWESHETTVINYKKNGEEFWINFTVTPVADENGRYTHWVAIERDVTEQKNSELEKELISKISNDFNQKITFSDSVQELCQTIKEFGNFDLVEVWVPNIGKSKIQLISHATKNADIEKFYDETSEYLLFNKSEGLPGQVWATGTLIHWADISNHKDFLRKEAAKKTGLNTFMSIPLFFNNEVVGVLQIGSQHDYRHLEKYAKIFTKLQTFIGSEFYRKKLENDLAHLLNSVPDLICILDFDGKFLQVNKAGCELLGYTEAELLYQSFDTFLDPKDKRNTFSEVVQHEFEESIATFEKLFSTKSGETISLLWNCNKAEEEGYIYASAKNVTEEKKLRELNQQSRVLAKIGSWEVDLVKNSIFWSDEVHQMHETNPETFQPDLATGINFYREDFRPIVTKAIEKCMTTGEPFDFEAVLLTINKKELWVRSIGNPEFIDEQCVRIYGSFQDISTLKETENRLVAISSNLPGVIYQYVIHPDGTDAIKHIMGSVEKLWGYTTEEIYGNLQLLWYQIEMGGDLEMVKSSILQSIQTKSKWTCTFKIINTLGEIKTHLGNADPIFLTDGTIIFNTIIIDVTQEAKNELLLRVSNDRFEKVTEATNDAIWDWDLVNQTYYRSNSFEQLFGEGASGFFSEKELWTRDNYHPNDKERVRKEFDEAISNPEVFKWESEFRLINDLGQLFYVIDRSKIYRNSEGKAIRVVGAVTDISSQKQLSVELQLLNESLQHQTNELQRSNEELEQFAFVASHDLQEPLRMVASFMDLIKRKYGDKIDEKGHQYIYYATDGAKRMKKIILDLLDYSKANKTDQIKETIDLNELVSDYMKLRKKIISTRAVVFHTKELPILINYQVALTQIFHCLLDNAIKYTADGVRPIITIQAEDKNTEWEFSIGDNGIGIASEFYSKIFVIFQRLHNQSDYEGTGIGLSIAKRHVEHLGGKIWLDSTVGKGTTFYFTIPKN